MKGGRTDCRNCRLPPTHLLSKAIKVEAGVEFHKVAQTYNSSHFIGLLLLDKKNGRKLTQQTQGLVQKRYTRKLTIDTLLCLEFNCCSSAAVNQLKSLFCDSVQPNSPTREKRFPVFFYLSKRAAFFRRPIDTLLPYAISL